MKIIIKKINFLVEKLGYKKNFSFSLSVSLLIPLLLIRLARYASAFSDHFFRINSLSDIVFITLGILQDLLFCMILYIIFRLIIASTNKKMILFFIYAFLFFFVYLIFIYNLVDLFYFKNFGRSLTWRVISQESTKLGNFWDSAGKYYSPYIIFVFFFSIILIGPGSIIINILISRKWILYEKKIFINKFDIIVFSCVLIFIILNVIVLSSENSLYSGIKSIPVYNFLSSVFSQINNSSKKNINKKIELVDFNRDSAYFSLSKSDREIQQKIKSRLEKFKNKKFNVIFYLSESVYAGRLKSYGSDRNVMPFLDKLTGNSLFFENMYTTSVRSMNSLISLLTGLGGYPGFAVLTDVCPRIETPALSQILHKESYSSCLIHSGYFSFYNKLNFLNNRDFDYLADINTLRKKYPDYWRFSWGIDDMAMVNEGLSWIDGQVEQKKNFFLTFVPIIPHHPYDIPQGAEKLIPSPNNIYENYLNSLYYVDHVFQSLYKGLEERGLLENTIIVFLGDHGEAFSMYHKGNWGHSNNIYEENIKIPAIMFNPLLFDEHYKFDAIVNTSDIFATVVEILGQEKPIGSQGESVLHMNTAKVSFVGTGNYDIIVALRDGKYKAIYNYNKDSLQLYDLTGTIVENTDISQRENIIAQHYKKRLVGYYNYQTEYFENFNEVIKKINAGSCKNEEISLLDLEPSFSAQNRYSILKNRTSKNNDIIINSKLYNKGYGVYGNSIMIFDVSGLDTKRLKGYAGKVDISFDNTDIKNAQVKAIDPKNVQHFLEMVIIVDGEQVFTTGKITNNQPVIPFDINITDAKQIQLMVQDAGDGETDDNAVWLDPVLVR